MNEQLLHADMMKCDKLSQVIPYIYYHIQQLKILSNQFENNHLIKQAEEPLLAIYLLLEIKEKNKAEYIQKYRDLLTLSLQYLSEFITQLEHVDILDSQAICFSTTLDNLSKNQMEIMAIIEE